MKRALITGATGFIGGHLARELSKNGWTVSAVIRAGSRKSSPHGIRSFQYDGNTSSLAFAFSKSQPSVVFHLASLYIAEHSPEDIPRLISSNITFGTQLAESMLSAGASSLVNAGTSWQNYRDAPYEPANLYAATKQALDDILVYYQKARGLKTITLKLFDTYGPNDARPKLLAHLKRARTERLAFSPGKQLIDLVHVDDAVRAFRLAGERLLSGRVKGAETYSVSSGHPCTLRRISALFEKEFGASLSIDWGALPYRRREVMRPWSKGRQLPGWKPRITLERGFRGLHEAGF